MQTCCKQKCFRDMNKDCLCKVRQRHRTSCSAAKVTKKRRRGPRTGPTPTSSVCPGSHEETHGRERRSVVALEELLLLQSVVTPDTDLVSLVDLLHFVPCYF